MHYLRLDGGRTDSQALHGTATATGATVERYNTVRSHPLCHICHYALPALSRVGSERIKRSRCNMPSNWSYPFIDA